MSSSADDWYPSCRYRARPRPRALRYSFPPHPEESCGRAGRQRREAATSSVYGGKLHARCSSPLGTPTPPGATDSRSLPYSGSSMHIHVSMKPDSCSTRDKSQCAPPSFTSPRPLGYPSNILNEYQHSSPVTAEAQWDPPCHRAIAPRSSRGPSSRTDPDTHHRMCIQPEQGVCEAPPRAGRHTLTTHFPELCQNTAHAGRACVPTRRSALGSRRCASPQLRPTVRHTLRQLKPLARLRPAFREGHRRLPAPPSGLERAAEPAMRWGQSPARPAPSHPPPAVPRACSLVRRMNLLAVRPPDHPPMAGRASP